MPSWKIGWDKAAEERIKGHNERTRRTYTFIRQDGGHTSWTPDGGMTKKDVENAVRHFEMRGYVLQEEGEEERWIDIPLRGAIVERMQTKDASRSEVLWYRLWSW